MKLCVRGVTKRYAGTRGETHALEPVDLHLESGEFLSLVGPSGCGKSTLLHIVAGLEPASSGSVELEGEAVRGPGAELGLVLQRPTLFPWLTLLENVRFPETLKRRAPAAGEGRSDSWVDSLLKLTGLWDFRHAMPAELSGGMQQRAAIARALVSRPEVLLMDEPFGALDAQTREDMQELLLHVSVRHRITTLFVTHDVDEALLLSDRVVVFSARPGRIVRELVVPFSRSVRTSELKLLPPFQELRRTVLGELRRPAGTDERSRFLEGLAS